MKRKDYLIIIIAIIINLPLFLLSIIRTNKTILSTGDISPVEDVFEIDNEKINGSYSTVYVISVERCTYIQSILANAIKNVDIYTMSSGTNHISNSELNIIGKIQQESSLQTSIISAYTLLSNSSNINLEYTLKSLVITYYSKNSNLKIGDEIVGINDISIKDSGFKDSFYNRKYGDYYQIIRQKNLLTIPVTDEKIIFYPYYNIDFVSMNPQIKFTFPETVGPSGGFLRALYLFDLISEKDIAKGRKIVGTGTIDEFGNIGEIGGIKQKIQAAYNNHAEVFYCPVDNYVEALSFYNLMRMQNMRLVPVKNLEEAIKDLLNEY